MSSSVQGVSSSGCFDLSTSVVTVFTICEVEFYACVKQKVVIVNQGLECDDHPAVSVPRRVSCIYHAVMSVLVSYLCQISWYLYT